MNDPREKQLARFRANLQTRVRTITAQLEVLEYMPSDPEATRQVQGELHTLKGESRMIGLVAFSDLVHAMEEHVALGSGIDFARLGGALDAMRHVLSENVAAADGEQNLAGVRAALFETETQPATSSPQPVPATTPTTGPDEPALPTTTAAEAEEGRRRGKADRWVQVNASVVDALCEEMSNLASSFGRLQELAKQSISGASTQHSVRTALGSSFAECAELLSGCVDRTWSLRLVPIAPMLRELEQHVKLQARRQGKTIEVQVDAGRAELERDVVDQVWDTLLHLAQNAVAHGIEPASERGDKPALGTVRIRAESAGANVAISVADDGRGIDLERVRETAASYGIIAEDAARELDDEAASQLIFHHGFSTQREADELAGRGVGLAVVKNKIEAIGGTVTLRTQRFKGSAFTLTVPFAITKERVLVVDTGAGLYGIPSRVIRSVVGADELNGAMNNGQELLRHGEDYVPVHSLCQALGLPSTLSESSALLLMLGGRLFGARVPTIIGEQDLIRRPAEALLSRTTGIGASATLSDGRLVLMPEFGFLERALSEGKRDASLLRPHTAAAKKRSRVLVVDDSPVVTSMVGELLTSSGLSIQIAGNGLEALAAIEREWPDLVISDLEMPQMNGLELLAAIRQRSQTLPVVMLTTRGSTEDRQRASSLGANAYVLKTGFRSDVLLDVVRRFLPTQS